jgi:hypothetical protein
MRMSPEEFDKQTDKVCMWCKPPHVVSGPHKGDVLTEQQRDSLTYKGAPMTSTICKSALKKRLYAG